MTKQEILEGNVFIGLYLGMEHVNDCPEEYPSGYYIPRESELDISYTPDEWSFHESMDWLYPVYQKITKYSGSIEVDKLDSYTKMQIRTKYLTIRGLVAAAFNIDHIFKEIVEWIKIYNLKVLEDGKQI